MIASFEGWNDAGDAASTAVSHIAEVWDAESFADIDPEQYFDFSSTRPEVGFTEGGVREIVWPTNEFFVAPLGESGRDVVLLLGDGTVLETPDTSTPEDTNSPPPDTSTRDTNPVFDSGPDTTRPDG